MNLTLEELRAAAALREQQHRRALAFLEVLRRQQNGPLTEGSFASPLVRSFGAGQIGEDGIAAQTLENSRGVNTSAVATDLKQFGNAALGALQRNAPSVAEANNGRALNVPFSSGTVAATASAPAQRGFGGAQRSSGGKTNTPEQVGVAAVESINQKSIDENREYCGTIERKVTTTVNDDGTTIENVIYYASQAIPGEKNKCRSSGRESTTVGRYHTHGDYSRETKSGRIVRTTKNRDGFDSDNWNEPDRRVRNHLARKTRRARRERDEKFTDVLGTPSGNILVKEVN